MKNKTQCAMTKFCKRSHNAIINMVNKLPVPDSSLWMAAVQLWILLAGIVIREKPKNIFPALLHTQPSSGLQRNARNAPALIQEAHAWCARSAEVFLHAEIEHSNATAVCKSVAWPQSSWHSSWCIMVCQWLAGTNYCTSKEFVTNWKPAPYFLLSRNIFRQIQ